MTHLLSLLGMSIIIHCDRVSSWFERNLGERDLAELAAVLDALDLRPIGVLEIAQKSGGDADVPFKGWGVELIEGFETDDALVVVAVGKEEAYRKGFIECCGWWSSYRQAGDTASGNKGRKKCEELFESHHSGEVSRCLLTKLVEAGGLWCCATDVGVLF